ncbi:putative tanscription initiation factor IIB [Piromyces finnis]|uniref:RNA polymerase II transcription factor B subunit 2 n=1 Tax=Piromyces finnis TaxID=1754191 RepID=A0A1Y1V631_9FUNG|nr:putative tanscription initiation factor IIB [Piromyces finnis]|eukprot:ORX47626.1 putative tanscription initiation factor IIB [Piromyces finnis]
MLYSANSTINNTASESIQGDVSVFLEKLSDREFQRLYTQPATCLAIFRLLPDLAKQFIMRLLYIKKDVPLEHIKGWCYEQYTDKVDDSLQRLYKLHICTKNENDEIRMSKVFQENLNNALIGSGNHTSFGSTSTSIDKHKVDIDFLDKHGTEQWEAVLHYMVGANIRKKPSPAVLKLLERSGLMAKKDDDVKDEFSVFTKVDINELQITNKGFQFLLQDVNTQVWAFLIQYLNMVDDLKMDLVEVLNFLFQLGSLQLGADYSVESLTPTQQQMLNDLKHLGIIYQRKRGSKRFYPTRLATSLTSGSMLISKPSTEDSGFIILETNSRIYAYTDSPLQISVLNLFVVLKARFANMVVGMITRDSIRSALNHGITADQIITYLRTHAHPEMKKNMPILPLTVVDQIRLWEMERNRLKDEKGYLYHEFARAEDFQEVLNYAKQYNVVKWSNVKKRMLVVTMEGHIKVRAYIKKRIGSKQSSQHRQQQQQQMLQQRH